MPTRLISIVSKPISIVVVVVVIVVVVAQKIVIDYQVKFHQDPIFRYGDICKTILVFV